MDVTKAQFVRVDGLDIRCLKGPERPGVPLLLTSPWPESLFAFHKIWPRLIEQASVTAVDLPGFGLSQGRADVLSPSGMGRFIPQIMGALGLERVHAVAPDVGTAAFLFATKDAPVLFESLVVGSGATAVDTAAATLKDLIVAPSLAQLETQDGSTIALAAVDRMMRSELPRDIRDDYAAASAGRRFVEAAAYVRSYPGELVKLRAALGSVSTPVLGIWGQNDTIVPPINAQLLLERLPRSTAIYLDAGHFAWEEQSDVYATAVLDWVAGGYRRL
ncbi:MAG TPA: alpha/beta hydrolase [Caulobacteraceae bacterium]|nr:alpha/beta hydrolase [Caulobacteraceae bacterium]